LVLVRERRLVLNLAWSSVAVSGGCASIRQNTDLTRSASCWCLGPRPKTFLPLRRVAASLGKVSNKKFGRLRLVPKSGLSAERLGHTHLAAGKQPAVAGGAHEERRRRGQHQTAVDQQRRRRARRGHQGAHFHVSKRTRAD